MTQPKMSSSPQRVDFGYKPGTSRRDTVSDGKFLTCVYTVEGRGGVFRFL
ncbi:hypothetical protein IQ244_14785 [Nostoc sp. LEGE 06077]|nr:hypothetical protein [Nostoc sp. LEGE 06077]